MARHRRPRAAKYLQTLIFYDEPQLMLLSTEGDSLLIALAIEDDILQDPYLAAEISKDQYGEYLAERFDLRYLFTNPYFKAWYFFEGTQSNNGWYPLYRVTGPEHLKPSVWPGHGLFARDHTEDTQEYSVAYQANETFDIDGSWDFPEFGKFYGQYTDLYVVVHSAEIFANDNEPHVRKRQLQEAFLKPWRGGGSYVSFYDSLFYAQERQDRLRVGAIKYASPGYVDIKGNPKAFAEMRLLIESYSANSAALTKEYKDLYQFLAGLKLLKVPPEKFDRTSDLAGEVGERARNFAAQYRVFSYETFFEMSGRDHLVTAKVLLSIHRRIEKLYQFFRQGRVSFPKDRGASFEVS